MSGSSPILQLSGAKLALGERESRFEVGPIDLELWPGEMLALVGSSGAGKSTLLGMLSGARPLQQGQSLLTAGGIEIPLHGSRGASWRRARVHLGFVQQDPSGCLNARRSVLDQVADPLRIHSVCSAADARLWALDELASVGISEALALKFPTQLSGGQRQRAAIARATVHRPKLLCLDEPTSSLDPSVQAEVLQVLRDRLTAERTVVLVTHDLAVVRSLATRVFVMEQGRKVEYGSVEECLSEPQSAELRHLIAAATFA